MTGGPPAELTLVWPYPVRTFDVARLEIEEIRSSVDVRVLDASPILSPTIVDAYSERSSDPAVRVVEDLTELHARAERKMTVIWSALKGLRTEERPIARRLRRGGDPVVWQYSTATPVPRATPWGRTWQPPELAKRSFHLGRSWAMRGIHPHVVLCAAAYDVGLAGRDFRGRAAIVRASAVDVSRMDRHLLAERSGSAVYLDTGFPGFVRDEALFGVREAVQSEEWYPALGRFFARVERLTGTQLTVAVHPKHDARDHRPFFGERAAVVGRTPELIRRADVVIATNSTAIGMAVMHRKPLLLVTSRAAEGVDRKREQIALNARETGARVFNIDEEYTDDEIRAALVVDEAKYARYTRKYLTTRTDDKRNYEILLEEVIWPYAELYRAEQERTGVGPDGPLGRRSRKRIIRQLQRRIRERNDVSDLLREAREMKKVEDAEWREWRRRDRRERRARTRAARAVQAERAGA
ncbi:MAG: hypothetical protein ACO26C_03480 [Ilumatobacteraceae bacterium]